ncbi:hypothetical protein [Longispora albida]|uniref:hypothetical protein n=1 Tax=Longispora albida TaxID=203523 RepID=UPI0012FA1F9B|nr:hypothetical protein [Longispora albida]
MSVRLAGANPAVVLFDGDRPVALASAWRVDWSERGAGRALVTWYQEKVSVFCTSRELGQWLVEDFVRHFPDLPGVVRWEAAEYVVDDDVQVVVDLERGLSARGGGVVVEIGPPVARRAVVIPEFALGPVTNRLQLVYAPSETASITVDGVRLGGEPRHAFLAEAEVWSHPAPAGA